MNEVESKAIEIKDMIYEIRGKQVMFYSEILRTKCYRTDASYEC